MRILLVAVLCAAVASGCAPNRRPLDPGDTVARVDLDRYAGRWYEIARIPNRFQRSCAGDVTADYRPRTDGGIDVVNRCRKAGGDVIEARGVARVVDDDTRARLEVSFVNLFGVRLFWGDYWVLDLDDGYAHSLVGTPDRRYGWVLSRTPTLSPATVQGIFHRMEGLGYDPAAFVMTEQGGTVSTADG
jgi:apolipoprotein D and lipocalin family protein